MNDLTLTHHQITRGTTPLHYWLAGSTDRPLVVFTHGGMMDHRMFEAQLAPVAQDYRVLLWDVHGHGQSQPMGMEGVFTLRIVVDDLLAIVDSLGYQQACFVGQSLGASISQELAFLSPERVAALVVIGGTSLVMENPQVVRPKLQGTLGSVPPSEVEQSLADIAALQPAVKAYVQEVSSRISKETLLAIRKALPGFFHEEMDYRLPMPFLLTHGAQDALKDIVRLARLWAQREPQCQYVIIPDAGHNANQDNPAFFNQVLLTFLHQHIPLTIER